MVIRLLMLLVGILKLTATKEKIQGEDGNRLHVNNKRIMFVAKSITRSQIVL